MIETMSTAQPPAPVTMIVGADEFLVERHRMEIVDAARAASGNSALPVESCAASELSESEIYGLLSPSLFAEDRVISIRGIDTVSKEITDVLEKFIAEPAPGTVLIVEHSGKGRNKKLVQSWPKLGARVLQAQELRAHELPGFVTQEFRNHRVRVDPDVAQYIVSVVGSDLRELASAVSQLIADTNANVTIDAVTKYYSGRAEVSGFEVAELACTGRAAQAISAGRRALQVGAEPVQLSSALAIMIGDIASVSEQRRIDPRKDAGVYGMPPWKLEKTIKLARSWSPAAVAAAVQIVGDLEVKVRGAARDKEFAVEEAIRSIAQLAATGHR